MVRKTTLLILGLIILGWFGKSRAKGEYLILITVNFLLTFVGNSTEPNCNITDEENTSGDAFYVEDEDSFSDDDAFDVMYDVDPEPTLSAREIIKYNKVVFQRGNGYNIETGKKVLLTKLRSICGI